MLLVALGSLLFIGGLVGKLMGMDGAILLVGPGMILFVFGAWRAANPVPRRDG